VTIPAALGNAPFDFDPGGARFVATGAVLDLPAIAIVAALTCVLVRGIRESARFNAVMVAVKLAIIASLLVCTVLYITVATVLTGMVPSSQLDIDAPVASAFAQP
jgi:APA family basic amino acid/polyamine antiporter